MRIAATVGGGLGLGDGEGLGGPCSIFGDGLVVGLFMHTSLLGRGFVVPRHVCMSSSGSVWERKKRECVSWVSVRVFVWSEISVFGESRMDRPPEDSMPKCSYCIVMGSSSSTRRLQLWWGTILLTTSPRVALQCWGDLKLLCYPVIRADN